MGRGTPNGGRGAARSNHSAHGGRGAGQNRDSRLDVSALGLVSPLSGGTGRTDLNALRATAWMGGLGGLQQATQLSGLLGGRGCSSGGVSNGLAGLCALLGGSQSHDVTLNAM